MVAVRTTIPGRGAFYNTAYHNTIPATGFQPMIFCSCVKPVWPCHHTTTRIARMGGPCKTIWSNPCYDPTPPHGPSWESWNGCGWNPTIAMTTTTITKRRRPNKSKHSKPWFKPSCRHPRRRPYHPTTTRTTTRPPTLIGHPLREPWFWSHHHTLALRIGPRHHSCCCCTCWIAFWTWNHPLLYYRRDGLFP